MSNALELSLDEFKKLNIKTNQKLKDAFLKNQNYKYEPVLPKPDVIYEKEFHFLDETLIKKEQRRERKEQRKIEKEKEQPTTKKEPAQPEVAENDKKLESAKGEPEQLELKEQTMSDEKEKINDANIQNVIQSIVISNKAAFTQQNLGPSEKGEQEEGLVGQKKKGMQQSHPHTIKLTNQKDFSHDLTDRSLSKIRASNVFSF